MHESIDWPRPPRPRNRRRFFIIILVILAVIFFGGRTSLSYYVDLLWFRSLGLWARLLENTEPSVGNLRGFCCRHFLILYGSFLALKRAHLPDLPEGHTIVIGGQPVKLPVEPVLRLIALGASLAIAAATGAAMIAEWPTFALFWYAPQTTSVVDPNFW